MAKLGAFTIIFLLTLSLLNAQEEGVQDLNLDELAAVNLNKSSLPIKVDSVKALSGNTINIGFILPISKFGDFSKELIDGSQLAIEEINASGKILNKELYLIPADDATEAEFALQKRKELTSKYQVSGILGPTSSSRFTAVVESLFPQSPAVIISPTTTAIGITNLEDNGLAFRTAPSDAVQGKTAAFLSARNFNQKTAAVFYINNTYGRGLAEEFTKNFEAAGGQVTGTEKYSPMVDLNDYDVTPKLMDLLAHKPEAIYLVTNNVDIVNIFNQVDNAQLFKDYRPTLIATDAARGSMGLPEESKEIMEGLYGTSVSSLSGKYFMKKFETRYGYHPTYYETGDVYDIIYLLALAIVEGQSTDPYMISKHLHTVSASGTKVRADDFAKSLQLLKEGKDVDYEGINSDLDFDQYGDVPNRKYQVWQIVNGDFKDHIVEVDIH